MAGWREGVWAGSKAVVLVSRARRAGLPAVVVPARFAAAGAPASALVPTLVAQAIFI